MNEQVSRRFDTVALTSSAIYFILFTVLLGNLVQSNEDTDSLYYGLIATLILPILFFMKKAFEASNRSEKVQKTILSLYFVVVMLNMILHLTYKDAKKVVAYVRATILPLLVLSSLYVIIYVVKRAPNPSWFGNALFTLPVLLTFLYLFSSIEACQEITTDNFKREKVIMVIEMIISIMLVINFFLASFGRGIGVAISH